MLRFLVMRLARWVIGVVVLLLVVYALMFFGGGDPVRIMYSEAGIRAFRPGDPVYEALRADLGLDRPFIVQFGDYVWKAVHGDLGISFQHKRSVLTILMGALPVTMQIAFSAMLIIILVGIPLGVIAALKQNTWVDNSILGGALFFWGVPSHVLAPLLMVVFCLWWPILPIPTGWKGPFKLIAVLPLAVAAIRPMAIVIRQSRSAVLEVLSEDYIRTARAKGLPEWVIVVKHALRPVLTPVVTQVGVTLAHLLSGSLLLEIVFGIPGLGRLIRDAIIYSDIPVILACCLVVLAMVTLVNLLVELSYPLLDPRLKTAQRGGSE